MSFSGNTSFSGRMDFGGSSGGQYKISSPAPRRQMEHAVRPFQVVESAPPELPPVRRLRPGEDTEASICAGAPARFLRSDLTDPISMNEFTSRIIAIWPNNPPDDDQPPGAIVYDEVSREVSVIRVENPNDAAQFVDVERIETIDFVNRTTGIQVRFNLNHL